MALPRNAQKVVKSLRDFQDSCTGKAWSHVQRAIALVVTAATGRARRAPSKLTGKRKSRKKSAKS